MTATVVVRRARLSASQYHRGDMGLEGRTIDGLATTGRLLVRSGIEIGRTMDAMLADGDMVTALWQQGERLFLSRLLRVDPVQEWFAVACDAKPQANEALLATAAVTFTCNHRGAHYNFVATAPALVEIDGAPALRFAFPLALYAHQRRAQPRVQVPARIPLRCEIPWGPLTLDAEVVDVSLDGVGTIVYGSDVQLAIGAKLERVRIVHPERGPVVVGLEVRYAVRIVGRDGMPATRSGCCFLGAPRDLQDLIRVFVTELDARVQAENHQGEPP
jgi:c-di-GMP-binding flagellar brake protein YcgR